MKRAAGFAAGLLVLAALHAAPGAQQMPDPKTIAGVPLPVGDVTNGTVVVRVIRGSLSNNIPDQKVDLLGADLTATTDANGRAQFDAVKPGTRVTAVATVAGERLQSQEFPVPATGGIRVLLVATDPEQQKRAEQDRQLAAGPAQRGSVALGEESRFVFEFGDESISVFNIFQILNTARTPVHRRSSRSCSIFRTDRRARRSSRAPRLRPSSKRIEASSLDHSLQARRSCSSRIRCRTRQGTSASNKCCPCRSAA